MYVTPCSLVDTNIPYLSYRLSTELQDTSSQKIASFAVTIGKNLKIKKKLTSRSHEFVFRRRTNDCTSCHLITAYSCLITHVQFVFITDVFPTSVLYFGSLTVRS